MMNEINGEVIWNAATQEGLYWDPYLADDGSAYVLSEESLIAFDPDGMRLWTVVLEDSPVSQALTSDGQRLFLALTESPLRAISRDTGDVLWSAEFEETLGVGIAWGDGRVYAATRDGRVSAVSPEDGRLLWSTLVDERTGHSLFYSRVTQSLIAAGLPGIFGFGASETRILNPMTGEIMMTLPALGSPPYVTSERTLYAWSGQYVAIDFFTGETFWSSSTVSPIKYPAVSNAGGLLFLQREPGVLTAVSEPLKPPIGLPRLLIDRVSPDTVQLKLNDAITRNLHLEVSTDLRNWEPLLTPFENLDTMIAKDGPAFFFRVRQE